MAAVLPRSLLQVVLTFANFVLGCVPDVFVPINPVRRSMRK